MVQSMGGQSYWSFMSEICTHYVHRKISPYTIAASSCSMYIYMHICHC